MHLYGLSDTAILRHFTIENGLPSNNVYAVTQDKYGYMWFNTDNGVVKYNGYTFKLFTVRDGLPSNDVWKLYPDKRGRMWVSTHANIIGYIKDDKYKALITSKTKAIHPNYINCDKNNVYFLYGDLGEMVLAVVDSNDDVKTSLISSIGNKRSRAIFNSIGEKNVLIVAKSDSTIYTRHLSESLIKTDSEKMNFSIWKFTIDGGAMSYYGGKLINLGLAHNYILVVNQDGKYFDKIYFPQFGGKNNETIYTSYEENDSMTVITNAAAYRINPDLIHARRIDFTGLLPNGQLAYYTIDKFGNEWYASVNKGVWCQYQLSNVLRANRTSEQLLNTTLIGKLSNGNTYWYNKKVNEILELSKDKKVKKVNPPNNEIPNVITNKNDSEFYMGTNKNTYIFSERTYNYYTLSDYYSINSIKRYNLAVEPAYVTDKKMVRSGFYHSYNIIQLRTNKWLEITLNPTLRVIEVNNGVAVIKGLDNQRITNMCYDSLDNLYIFSGVNKMAAYNPRNDKYISVDLEILNSIGINAVQGIAADKFSNIYILNNDRLVAYNMHAQRIQYLKCGFNLSDAHLCIYGNMIFVAGKFGLAYAKILGPLDLGKFKVAVNQNSYNRVYDFVINKQGTIYIFTDKGVIDVNAEEIINRKLADPNGFFMLNINAPIHRRIIGNDTVNFSQDVDKISLNIVNLVGKGNIQYNYVIEGYGGWQETTTGEIVTSTLKAGRYYKVRCSIRDDAWVSKEFVFYIYRVPYWWQKTNWIIVFWISGILAFGAIIFIVMLLTRRAVAKANDKKRALTELELRAIYAQINPHFIFNTLSATLYFINKRKFDEAYLHINKFSRLIRGYLKSSQERYITLADEIEMLRNYIELQKTRFEDKLEYQIEIDNKVPVNNIQIPSLLLQPLVENAINHGLFHRKEGGVLLLQFLQGESSQELICIIDDNGVGRSRAKEIKESSTVQYDSYGTKLTKQLIDVFKEFEKMGIVLEYIDKQLPETGTIVKLTIKNIKYVA